MKLLLLLLTMAGCTWPMQYDEMPPPDAKACSLTRSNRFAGCSDCLILKSVADVDILAVYVDGVKLWPKSWAIDDRNCLELAECGDDVREVTIEAACLPPRTKPGGAK